MQNMTYSEALAYVESLKDRGIVPGLSNMIRLCETLGNPQDCIKTVHIAGTNGKGSVGAYLGKILECEGYYTGRYVSPSVGDTLESFLINGTAVSEDDYAQCMSIVRDAAKRIEREGFFPTPFETETAAAFVLFKMKKCDFALIECGMGGRLDATNVIKSPVCSVITKISTDHTAFLGNTIAEIASEKAGIIKQGGFAVSARQCDDAAAVIAEKCRELCTPIEFADKAEIITGGLDGIDFSYKGKTYHTSLSGLYQAQNAALAICTAQRMGISEKAISEGVKKARWAYRFEVISREPLVILDGAHNPDGAAELARTVGRYFKKEDVTFVFGMFRDKDYEKTAELTAPLCKKIYTVKPPSERGLEAETLAETVKKYNENVAVSDIETAVWQAEESRVTVCFGSLSFLERAKTAALMKKYQRIYEHPLYKKLLKNIEIAEKDRIFCLHGTEHSLDTARIAYITALENNLPYSKDIIYAAALLHDIGRHNSEKEHHMSSAEFAEVIMRECGYGKADIDTVCRAVVNHRKRGADGLSELLYRADKLSRNCFNCKAYGECYWSEEKKNKLIEV